MKKMKPSIIDPLALVTHALFIAGATLLFVYSDETGRPIHLEHYMLHQTILLYGIGYVTVFVKWLSLIKSDKRFIGKADDVPGYLTRELWGAFPYLGTLGNSNSGNQRLNNKSSHVYDDASVNGKTFREIFVLHINKQVVLILSTVCVFLPYVFLNQAAPSFLKFVYSYPLIFTIYLSFFIFAWMSSVALLVLRINLWAKSKLSNVGI